MFGDGSGSGKGANDDLASSSPTPRRRRRLLLSTKLPLGASGDVFRNPITYCDYSRLECVLG